MALPKTDTGNILVLMIDTDDHKTPATIDHARLSVSGLPELPAGTRIKCVDIIIRVCKS